MLRWRPVVWPWPCDPKSKKDNFLSKVKHRLIKYWVHLDLGQCDQKINGKHLFSRGKRSRDFKQTTFFQRQAVWPWPLSMWLENQNGYLFLMGIHSFKFGNCQAKTSKDIEKRSYTAPSLATFKKNGQKILSGHRLVCRRTDQPIDRCKRICPFFLQREHKIWISKNLHSKCWCIKLKIFFKTTWKKIMPPLKKGAYCFAPIGRSVALQIKQCPLNISRPPISLDHTLSRSRWRSNWYSVFYDPLFGGYQTCYTGGL